VLKKPKYTYTRNGNTWVIRRWTYTPSGAQGTKVDEKFSEDEAKREVYRLNGWKLKAV
jgi:hypothetical protein